MLAHAPLALALLPLALGGTTTAPPLTHIPANSYVPSGTTISAVVPTVITAPSEAANGTVRGFQKPAAGDEWITGGGSYDAGANWASWWPAAGVETDLWLGGLAEPIALAKNVAGDTVGAGALGRNVTSGRGFYVFLAEAGNVEKILAQSAQFDIRRAGAASAVAPGLGLLAAALALALM
ncbi:hypothetical protein Q8F55_009000 [Vanrija albida]|uniref:Uncharacterized protein n=1 Tax=Vanrija albida TaxID=181172 RepID=A0ABR3PSE6_9TREE